MDDEEARRTTEKMAVVTRDCRWFLEVQDGCASRRIVLGSSVVAGSSKDASLTVSDPAVSAKHCRISVLGSGLVVEDLGSKNGTYVGGVRVTQAWVPGEATITVGRATITCLCIVGEPRVADGYLEPPLAGLAGGCVEMRRLAARVRRLARHSAPVLIHGESGTGKELIARALHDEGPRRSGPFIVVNVAALPRELVEAEMFGYERGAFTGATSRNVGRFTEAEGGTLFLDEIGELPLEAQPKLLRALDGYEVRRIGGSGSGRPAHVRLVAATHVPLEERVTRGLFRRDLFHRLEVFVVSVPPLRERRGDIAPICRALLASAASEIGARDLSACAVARLTAQNWLGNVRELRNVLYRAADGVPIGGTIDGADIEAALTITTRRELAPMTSIAARAWLAEHGNNLSRAARAAGYPRTTFRKLLERSG